MPKNFDHHLPWMIGNQPMGQTQRSGVALPATQSLIGMIEAKRRGPHGPLELTLVDVRPPSGKLPQEGGIHALLAVLGAGTLVLFESIADAIAAPVAARRRGV